MNEYAIVVVFTQGENVYAVERDGTVLRLDQAALERDGLAKWKAVPLPDNRPPAMSRPPEQARP